VRRSLDEAGHKTFIVTGFDTMHLLKRRYNLWAATNAKAIAAAVDADNLLKDIFDNNLGATAGTGRDLSSLITTQIDLSAGPHITKDYPWANVLTTMQEIAQASTTAGTYLAFDIIATGSSFEFRTYTGQRGLDRRLTTNYALIIGPEFGNMTAAEVDDDHSDEITYVEVGGSDSGTLAATDAARVGQSPFGRIEYFETSSESTIAGLSDAADAALRAGRPRTSFSGVLNQTEGTRYGLHYAFGDYLTAQYEGITYDCRLDAVKVSIQGGAESVECILRVEA